MSLIDSLGPQNPGDGPMLRRLRLHQSWYRSKVLRLARWGATKGHAPRELGSVLTHEDAAAGHNFVSRSAFQLYKSRHAEGWGVDPRCTAHMTSSQALTLNLIGLLREDERWFLECLNAWLGRTDLHQIVSTRLEFAPAKRSLHLNDQTRIDVLLMALGANGSEVIAFEIKYGDRFNSRLVDISTAPYRDLAKVSGLWSTPAEVVENRRVNQLARVHALATSYARSEGIALPVSMIVAAHDADASAHEVAAQYGTCLSSPLVSLVGLRELGTILQAAVPVRHRAAADRFVVRYGNEDGSWTAQQVVEARAGDRVA